MKYPIESVSHNIFFTKNSDISHYLLILNNNIQLAFEKLPWSNPSENKSGFWKY